MQTGREHLSLRNELAAHARIDKKAEEAKLSNCITTLDSFVWRFGGNHGCLVLPLMQTNLDNVIKPGKNPIPMDLIKKVLRSVLKALMFLHQNHIIHGGLFVSTSFSPVRTLTVSDTEITTKSVMLMMDPSFDVEMCLSQVTPPKDKEYIRFPKPKMDEIAKSNTGFVLSDFGSGMLTRVLYGWDRGDV